jgi:hypothetical protein
VDSIEEMAWATERLSEINPSACRRHVERSHCIQKTANHYELLYDRLIELHGSTSQNLAVTRATSATAGVGGIT